MNYKQILRILLVLLTAILLGLYLRSAWETRYWLNLGREHLAERNFAGAIDSFRRSVSWYAPGISGTAAIEHLLSMSRDQSLEAEARDLALQELKRGLASSRGLLDGVNGRAQLMKSVDNALLEKVPAAEREKAVREVHPPTVHYGFQLLAQISFWGWCGSVLFGIWRGFDSKGAVIKGKIKIAAAMWLCFFMTWLFALRCA